MSIPKEPRQLMINLMYLVLTAMLALNVSAEIINAFFMLDKGIKHSNHIVDDGIAATISGMEGVIEKKPQFKPLVDQAKKVEPAVKELVAMIDKIRFDITNESGGVYCTEATKSKWEAKGYKGAKLHVQKEEKLEGKPSGKKDKDTPQRLMVLGGPDPEGNPREPMGPALRKSMLDTRQALITLIDEVAAMEIKGVNITPQDLENVKKGLLLEGEEELDHAYKAAGKESWEAHVFGYMPVAACYPLLRKFQNDAKNSAAQIVNFLSGQMGKKDLVYDKFDVFSSSSKPYILLGETYEAEIALGAFSSQADFSVNVGGRSLAVVDGKAAFSTKPSSVGTQTYKATISVTNPLTGDKETVTKDFMYEVGVPSVTVAADKMNVFYVGVDNPISVSAAGVSSNDMKVSASGNVTLKKAGKGKYIATASKPGGTTEISVSNTKTGKKLGGYTFRVKRIPDPVAKLTNNKTDGVVKSGEMKAQRGLMAILENFDFDARCSIQSFTMYYTRKRQDPVEIVSKSGKFGGKTLQAIQSAKPGDQYQFIGVKAKCPGDSSGRKVNGLAFNIK